MAPEPVIEVEVKQQKGVRRKHRCLYCPKVYLVYHSLTRHTKSVHPDHQMIQCLSCRVVFLTEEEKEEHLKKQHRPQAKNKSFFKCIYCGQVSTKKTAHKAHLHTKHKGQVIRCGFLSCKLLMFKSKEERDQHIEEKHNFGQFFCCFCDRYFEEINTHRYHMKKKHKEALKCNAVYNCPNYFKTEEDRQKHVLEKHSKAKQKIKCIYCQKTYPGIENILIHVRKVHKDVVMIRCNYKNCATYFNTEEEKQKHNEEIHAKDKFFCIYCKKSFCSKGGFGAHLYKNHMKEEIIRCSYFLCVTYFKSDEEKLAHIKEVHERPDEKALCIYCNKFISKVPGSLSTHIRLHHSHIVVKCNFHDRCPTYFKTVEERDKHIKEVHHGVEKISIPQPCIYCDKFFGTLSSLKIHIKNKHLGVAIKCKRRTCGQFFKRQEDLENHYEQTPKHKLQKSVVNYPKNTFDCPLCPRTFLQKRNLLKHKRTRHEGIRDKCPHCEKTHSIATNTHIVSCFCEICNKKFLCKGLLKSHKLQCKPVHQCPVCAETFKINYFLNLHCKTKHTAHIQQWRGLKYKSLGFKCDECFVYFNKRCFLNQHFRIEHAVFDGDCHFCQHKFKNKDSLSFHIVKTHL